MITAKVQDNGRLLFHAFIPSGGSNQSLELSVDQWHDLGYGPMEWAAPSQRDFISNILVDRLRLVDESLFLDVTPISAYRKYEDLDIESSMVIKVRDLGTSFAVELYMSPEAQIPSSTMAIDEEGLKTAVGYSVRSIKWLASPIRHHLCQRMAALAKVSPDGVLSLDNGPVLVWRGVQRKIRQGNGPFLVSVYDCGETLELAFRDFKGVVLEQAKVSLKEFQTLVGREVWPMTMPADTREKTLHDLSRKVGGRILISGFDRFISLRPKADAPRPAASTDDSRPKTKILATTEEDVLEFIQKMHPDPTKLKQKDVEMLLQLRALMSETDRVSSANSHRQVRDAGQRPTGGLRCRSLYKVDPPPPSPICQCCNKEANKGHGRHCTHEYGVCRACVIASRTKAILAKNHQRHEMLPKLFIDLRPAGMEGDAGLQRKREVMRRRLQENGAMAATRKGDLAALMSPKMKFVVGVEVPKKTPPKKTKTKKRRAKNAGTDASSMSSTTSAFLAEGSGSLTSTELETPNASVELDSPMPSEKSGESPTVYFPRLSYMLTNWHLSMGH